MKFGTNGKTKRHQGVTKAPLGPKARNQRLSRSVRRWVRGPAGADFAPPGSPHR